MQEINLEEFKRETVKGISPVRKHISFDRDGTSEEDREGYKIVSELQNKGINVKKLTYILLKNAVEKAKE